MLYVSQATLRANNQLRIVKRMGVSSNLFTLALNWAGAWLSQCLSPEKDTIQQGEASELNWRLGGSWVLILGFLTAWLCNPMKEFFSPLGLNFLILKQQRIDHSSIFKLGSSNPVVPESCLQSSLAFIGFIYEDFFRKLLCIKRILLL